MLLSPLKRRFFSTLLCQYQTNDVLPDILLRGVKKFCQLVWVHPNMTIFGIKQDGSLAVHCVVDNDILLLVAEYML
jgi:hypothetical protein